MSFVTLVVICLVVAQSSPTASHASINIASILRDSFGIRAVADALAVDNTESASTLQLFAHYHMIVQQLLLADTDTLTRATLYVEDHLVDYLSSEKRAESITRVQQACVHLSRLLATCSNLMEIVTLQAELFYSLPQVQGFSLFIVFIFVGFFILLLQIMIEKLARVLDESASRSSTKQMPLSDAVSGRRGELVATGTSDRRICIWDPSDGNCVRILRDRHASAAGGGSFTCFEMVDNETLASGTSDNLVKVWSLVTGVCVRTLSGHYSSVSALRTLESGGVLASGSHDGKVKKSRKKEKWSIT